MRPSQANDAIIAMIAAIENKSGLRFSIKQPY